MKEDYGNTIVKTMKEAFFLDIREDILTAMILKNESSGKARKSFRKAPEAQHL
jgi:hypothetical protein